MDDAALLLPLFARLRNADIPLGVDEYRVALSSVRAGWGLEGPAALQATLRLLWAKSPEDQEVFDREFRLLVEPRLRPTPRPGRVEDSPGPDADGDQATEPLSPSSAGGEPLAGPGPGPSGPQPSLPTVEAEAGGVAEPPVASLGTYQLTTRPPLSMREMATIWRQVRRAQREGPAVEFDEARTIDSICRSGVFRGPVLRPLRRNKARLLILVDRSGSMEPFRLLVNGLLESTRRGGLAAAAPVYYFSNCPTGFLSADAGLLDPRPIEQVLAAHARAASVLIVSDAGAARRTLRPARVDCTRAFLRQVRDNTYRYAWLNPLPVERWEATTAEDVARWAPMFPFTRDGLLDTVSILRGRPFPSWVKLSSAGGG